MAPNNTLSLTYKYLMQMHALINPDEWDQAMGEDGALRAIVEARDEGGARRLGDAEIAPKALVAQRSTEHERVLAARAHGHAQLSGHADP